MKLNILKKRRSNRNKSKIAQVSVYPKRKGTVNCKRRKNATWTYNLNRTEYVHKITLNTKNVGGQNCCHSKSGIKISKKFKIIIGSSKMI